MRIRKFVLCLISVFFFFNVLTIDLRADSFHPEKFIQTIVDEASEVLSNRSSKEEKSKK